MVADKRTSTLGRNILISSTDIEMRNGITELATFGESLIDLGKNSDNTVISMNNGRGKISTVKGTLVIENDEAFTDDVLVYFEDDDDPIITYEANAASTTETIYTSRYDGEYRVVLRADIADMLANFESHDGVASYVSVKGDRGGVSPTVKMFARKVDGSSENYFLMTPTDSYSPHSIRTAMTFTADNGFVRGSVTERFTNNTLWTGSLWPSNTHTITFSSPVSNQPHGIVLIFSDYYNGSATNTRLHSFFVPKSAVSTYSGKPWCFTLMSEVCGYASVKVLNISDGKLTGGVENNYTGQGNNGVAYTNNRFVLRQVIGV